MGFISDTVSSVFGGSADTTAPDMVRQNNTALSARVDYATDKNIALQEALQKQALTGGGPLNDIFQNQLGQANQQGAGLMASAKGIDPGMAARMAAQATGQANQQAVAQGSQNQLQSQQLAAQNAGNITQLAQQNITQQNAANAGIAQAANEANAKGTGGILGGIGGTLAKAGLGAVTGGASLAVTGLAHGGEVPPANSHVHAYFAEGGTVPAMVSPGEVYLPPAKVQAVAQGADPIASGQKIPGTPKVKGDSLKNDVVPKNLKSGGIVIPNSVLQDKDPHTAAHAFVSKIMAKQGLKARRKK